MSAISRRQFQKNSVLAAAPLPGCKTTGLNGGADVTVRVANTPGGPRIHVNGEPVPPRLFSGLLDGSLRTGPEWRNVSFDFAPPAAGEGTGRGLVRFRFNHACEFLIRDIRITDRDSGEDVLTPGSFANAATFATVWSTFQEEKPKRPEPRASVTWTADGVKVRLEGEVSGWWPSFRLESRTGKLVFAHGRKYCCSFRVRSSARALVNVAVFWLKNGALAQIGEPPSDLFASQMKMARAAGIRFCHLQMPACFNSPEEAPDWQPLDRIFQRVLDVVPDALVVPRIEADAPDWWCKRHPEAIMTYEDGSKGNKCTVCSRAYRRDIAAHFEKLCRHLCKTFPGNFAGILPLGQGTYEWYYDRCLDQLVSGYDPVTEQAWRQWLKERGKENAPSATVPAAGRRHGAPNGMLCDPVTEADLVEFARFHQEQMADTILELAAACRRGTGGTKLVLFFYGYLFEMGMVKNGACDSGHYALSRVLASDNIDILCAPLSYTSRQWGGSAPCMTAAESVLAAGKLWLNEDDCRTHLAGTCSLDGVATPQQSIDILRRSRGQALLRGFADWWTDIRDMGWHDDPEMWRIQHQLNPVEQAKLARHTPFAPQILAVVDENSMLHLSGKSIELALPLVYYSRVAFGCCGAPYGQVMLDDVASGRVAAPLQFFLAAWALTDRQRDMLHKNRRPGVTRVWCHAPGYVRPTGFSAEGITEVTGFRVRAVDLATAMVAPTPAGAAMGLTTPWGQETRLKPLFSVVPEPGDRVLATFSDGSAALVLRILQTGIDAYLAVPALTSQLIRVLARAAGVHLYTEVEAGVWADGDMASIHVMADGPLKVSMPHAGTVSDLYSGRSFGNGPTIEIPCRKGETLLLRCE